MIKHEEMLLNFRDASGDTENRDNCLKDMERFYINFWDGAYGDKFKNKPKPQFNKLWRSINRIASDVNDMELNAVIVSNSHDATDEGAELLQKKYRNDWQNSDGPEASEIATMEACVGGLGATKWVAKYEDEENPDPDKQYLCAEIVQSACTSAWWDAGSNRKDKSDSRWGWHLIRTNRKSVEEEYGLSVVSFMGPATRQPNTTIELETTKDIYLAHYYEVVEKKLTIYDFSLLNGLRITAGDGIKDEMGNSYTRDDLKEIRDIYREEIGEDAPTTKKTIKFVEYALADGEKYLTKPQRTPFKRVPIFPRYGYYSTINGKEFFCGEVRKQLDAEMFHNLYASNMMSILNESPVQKPIFAPTQVAKYASSWARANIDDTPFLFADPLKDKDGNVLVSGPLGYQQPPQLGTGHAAVGQFLEQNLMQSNGTGQTTTPANTSGQAIQAVNDRSDDAYLPLVKNTIFAKRAECEAWIPAAQKLYFTNSVVIRVQEENGDYTNVTTMEMDTDSEGNYGPYKNNPRGQYTVQVKKGEAYKDTIEAKIQSNLELMSAVGSDTGAGQIIAYENMALLNKDSNPMIEAISRFAPLDIIIQSGFPYEPQNEEEAQYIQMRMMQMQQAQQQQQAMMMQTVGAEGRAREMEGQAALMNEQNDAVKNEIDMHKANTDRMKVMVEAEKAGADIRLKQSKFQLDAMGQMNVLQNSQRNVM